MTPSATAGTIPASQLQKGVIGWMNKALTSMGTNKSWVYSLVAGNVVIISQAYPMILKQQNPAELLAACKVAVQGQGTKDIQVANLANPPVDTTLTATAGTTVFGILVKLGNSLLNQKLGIYHFQFINNATTIGDVYVKANNIPVEFVMLSVTNTGGQASVTANTVPKCKVIAADSALTAADSFSMESLNERDLDKVTVG